MIKRPFLLVFLLFFLPKSKAQQWQNDLQIGLKEAAQQNKKVLLFFSVPERCESCNKLERNIFKSPEFIEFASENYVLVKIDFSYDAQELTKAQLEKNLLIVEKYNKDGFFPHVVVLNKDAKITNKVDVYNRETPQQYLSLLRRNSKS
jgi:thioredoxin-related protein